MHASLKHLALAGVVLATLSACGGSSGNSNGFIPFLPPPAPAPAPPLRRRPPRPAAWT